MTKHGVTKLADVAGPRAFAPVCEDVLGDRRLGIDLVRELAREDRDVVRALAQRWQLDAAYGEPMKQIVAKPTALDVVVDVATCGGDDADVDVNPLVAADVPDLGALDRPQQLPLEVEGKIAELVEQQRAVVSLLEEPHACCHCTGEGPAFVPEELGLDDVRRHGRAVEDDERAFGARTLLVKRAGDDLLARARLTLDQDGDGRRGKALEQWEESPHCTTLGQERTEARRVGRGLRLLLRLTRHEQRAASDRHPLAAHDERLDDEHTLDERAVLRAEIANVETRTRDLERDVASRDGGVRQPQLTRGALTDERFHRFRTIDAKREAFVRPVDDGQRERALVFASRRERLIELGRNFRMPRRGEGHADYIAEARPRAAVCYDRFVRALQRYVLYDEIASGGMASVHLGMLRAGGGFARLVAIKVMHAQYAKDQNFRQMFLDEARIVARVRDPHVVSTLDIIEEQNELFLVMDYVNGPSLAKVLKDLTDEEEQIPVRVAATIVMDLLEGLHAAHEARSESGEPLGVVHRDVSPHNVLIGSDGVSRVMDFGIAIAADQLHLTKPGEVKGKVGYMPPEQALGRGVDRRADVYAAGMVLFEALTLRRPFSGTNFTELAMQHITEAPPRPSLFRSEISPELDGVVLRAIAKKPDERFETARAMALALDALGLRLPRREVADWLAGVQREFLQQRDAVVTAVSQANPADAQAPSAHADVTNAPTRVTVRETREARSSWAARGGIAVLAASIGVAAFVGIRWRTGAHVPSALASQGDRASATPEQEVGSSVTPPLSASVQSNEVALVPIATTTPRTIEHRPHPHPTASASGNTTGDAPLPDCCVGDLRVKVRACRDNCSAGT